MSDIFGMLEDTDSLQGMGIIRRVEENQLINEFNANKQKRTTHGNKHVSRSTKYRILEMIQNDEFADALFEYELLTNQSSYQVSLSELVKSDIQNHAKSSLHRISFGMSPGRGTPNKAMKSVSIPASSLRKPNLLTKKAANRLNYADERETSATTVSGGSQVAANDSIVVCSDFPKDELLEVERGKLNCLMQLGHLENVVHHVSLFHL
jgi:hypothetical protein